MRKNNTVTQEQIDQLIENSNIHVSHGVFDKQCIVTLQLPNGFTITDYSACVDPENYDEDIGYHIALEKIIRRVWELEGYVLQERIYRDAERKLTSDRKRYEI